MRHLLCTGWYALSHLQFGAKQKISSVLDLTEVTEELSNLSRCSYTVISVICNRPVVPELLMRFHSVNQVL